MDSGRILGDAEELEGETHPPVRKRRSRRLKESVPATKSAVIGPATITNFYDGVVCRLRFVGVKKRERPYTRK